MPGSREYATAQRAHGLDGVGKIPMEDEEVVSNAPGTAAPTSNSANVNKVTPSEILRCGLHEAVYVSFSRIKMMSLFLIRVARHTTVARSLTRGLAGRLSRIYVGYADLISGSE